MQIHQTPHRRLLHVPAAIVVLALSLQLAACGANANQKALKASLTGVNAARDGFIAWDDKHQNEIVRAAASFTEGLAALTKYHQNRETVLNGFEVAYKALAIAAIEPTEENLIVMVGRIAQLYELIEVLTGKKMEMEALPPVN